MAELTQLQENFIINIFKGMNQRQAYLDAYPSSRTWQDNTVDSRACVLMKNEKVVKRLKELRGKVEKKALNTVAITLERTLQELSMLAFSNPAELFDENGNLIPMHELPEEVARSIGEVNTSIRMVGKGDDAEPYEITKIKQHDKKGSLDMLMKHLGAYEKDNKMKIDSRIVMVTEMPPEDKPEDVEIMEILKI